MLSSRNKKLVQCLFLGTTTLVSVNADGYNCSGACPAGKSLINPQHNITVPGPMNDTYHVIFETCAILDTGIKLTAKDDVIRCLAGQAQASDLGCLCADSGDPCPGICGDRGLSNPDMEISVPTPGGDSTIPVEQTCGELELAILVNLVEGDACFASQNVAFQAGCSCQKVDFAKGAGSSSSDGVGTSAGFFSVSFAVLATVLYLPSY